MRTQENRDIFREKVSVTASLQRPRRCYGALMACYRVPTLFMVEILCVLTVRSMRAHGAHIAVTSPRTPYSLRANATDDHGVCTTTHVCAHGAPIAL